MNRYSVLPGAVDQFNRTVNHTVWDSVAGPLAICANEEDAKKVAAALNEFEPAEIAPPVQPPVDREQDLCVRGGDHAPDQGGRCKKCGNFAIF